MSDQIYLNENNIANLIELIKFKSIKIIQILSSIEERKFIHNNGSLQSMLFQRSKEIVSLVLKRVASKQQNEASHANKKQKVNCFNSLRINKVNERDDQQKVLDLLNAIRKNSIEIVLKVERIESAIRNDQLLIKQRDEGKNQMQGNIIKFAIELIASIKIKQKLKRFWTFIKSSIKYFI
jgi:hypothetical protein